MLTDREIVELTRACGKRVCSTDEHFGCPFGDEGMVDCVERLGAAYDDTVDRLLELSDAKREGRIVIKKRICGTCRWREQFVGTCFNGESPHCADTVEGGDSCDHWEAKNN